MTHKAMSNHVFVVTAVLLFVILSMSACDKNTSSVQVVASSTKKFATGPAANLVDVPHIKCVANLEIPACKVVEELKAASIKLTGFDAEVGLSRLGLQQFRKPNEHDRMLTEADAYIATAMKLAATPLAKQAITVYRVKLLTCANSVLEATSKSGERFEEIKSACELGVKRAASAVADVMNVATASEKPDFRGLVWGANKAAAIATEGKPTAISNRELDYPVVIEGLPANAAFIFSEDKLTGGIYMFQVKHSENNLYITDFDNLKAALTQRYGKPSYAGESWVDPLFKDDRVRWGMAIAAGQMTMYSVWDRHATKITLMLRGDNFRIKLLLGYASKEFAPLADKTNSASASQGL